MSDELNFCDTVTLDVDNEQKKKDYSMSIERFDDITLPENFRKVAQHLKLTKPTPVQAWVWHPLLKGENVITKAETGSGKTLGFLLPIMESILKLKQGNVQQSPKKSLPLALILTPTRELAYQIYNLTQKITHIYNISTCIVTGGVDKEKLMSTLNSSFCDLLIATPGRLIDLLQQDFVELSQLHMITFDEADKMLDMGFKSQLSDIYKNIFNENENENEKKEKRDIQVMFFSATYQENIVELTQEWCSSSVPIHISISPPSLLSSKDTEISVCRNIIQDIHVCAEHKKQRKIMDFIRFVHEKDKQSGRRQRSLICVFVNTIKNAHDVYKFIHEKWDQGNPYVKNKSIKEEAKKPKPINVAILHGQLSQEIRNKLLANFRCGFIEVLVTTDVLGRGMDIPNLDYVLNYDFPSNLTTYVHRIGRTGRKGQQGYSRSFLTPRFYALTPDLELLLKASNQTVPPLLHTVAEEQRILREYNNWEQQRDEGKTTQSPITNSDSDVPNSENTNKQSIPEIDTNLKLKNTQNSHKTFNTSKDANNFNNNNKNSTKRALNEETQIRPKKVPLFPAKKRKL